MITDITERESTAGKQVLSQLQQAIREGNQQDALDMCSQLDILVFDTLVDPETAKKMLDVPKDEIDLPTFNQNGKRIKENSSEVRYRHSDIVEILHVE